MLESRPEGPLLNSSQGISTCDCLENRDIPVNSAVNHYCYPLDNQSQIHLGYGFIHINPKQGWVNSSTTMVSSWVLSTRLDAGRSGRGVSKMTDWWQMPYKYQTRHDWHDDHNGKFPELNMMIIFFWALLIIYIMFISFPFWWIQSPWCPPSFGVTRSQVTCSSGLRGSRLASASTGVRGWEDPRSHGMFHLHHNELLRLEGQLPQKRHATW